jgi:hypothetical protein
VHPNIRYADTVDAHQRPPIANCAPRSANPEKNQRLNISGRMVESECGAVTLG